MGFPVGSLVKNLPAIQEAHVWSMGPKDPQEKEMATHSGILDREIPWAGETGRPQSMKLQKTWKWLSD